MGRIGDLCPWLVAFCAVLGAEQPAVRVFTTDDGLARNWINQIYRDSKGYLWFGTRGGLSMFDGLQFTNYAIAEGLPHPNVTNILETRSGDYWIATMGGLCRWPSRSASPRRTTRPHFEPVLLGQNGEAVSVLNLLQDHSGALWIGTQSGLYRVQPDQSRLAPELVPLGTSDRPEIEGIAEDFQGRLWIATSAGLFRRIPSGSVQAIARLMPGVDTPHAILFDGNGTLWLGGPHGLAALGIDTEPPRLRIAYRKIADRALIVDAIHRAADGTLWLGSFGLIHFYPDSGSFESYPSSEVLGTQSISSIAEDVEGNLWIAVQPLGAARIPRERLYFYTEADGLESRKVQGLFLTRRSEVVAVSGFHLTLNRFNDTMFEHITPALPKSVVYLGWGHGPIALQDRTGDWWMATGNGVVRYTGVEDMRGLASRIPRLYSTGEGLPDPVVLRLFEDSRGDIWAGTYRGLGRFNRRDGRWTGYPGSVLLGNGGDVAPVHAIAEDRSGTIWAGVYPSGLYRLRDGRFQPVRAGVPPGSINFLFTDRRGWLWIATTQGGLAVMEHPEDSLPAIRVYNRQRGLSSDSTHCITEDHLGRIYVATAFGVDRLDPSTGRFQHFTTANGLPPAEIERLLCDRQGAIWFASNFGLARLIPQADDITNPPPPLLRSLRADGVPLLTAELGQRDFPGLELRPGQGNVEIDFFALHFRLGEKLRYQYRLTAVDRDWNQPVESQSAHYARLAPGRYRFEVRAVNDGQLASSQTASVSFRLLAPVWQRGWFQAAILVAALLAALALHRLRTEHLLQLERVRTRIATDLHDDIGASLSQMAILSEVIARRAGGSDSTLVQNYATKIAAIARELIDSMSDIVWTINPGKETLADLEQRMREFAGEMLLPRNIGLDFETAPADSKTPVGIEARREILLIFKEAIHNVVRHSGCTRTRVLLEYREGHLLLEVRDNGCGFAGRPGEGNGVCNMRRRADAIQGQLEFHSVEGEGAIMKLVVPLFGA